MSESIFNLIKEKEKNNKMKKILILCFIILAVIYSILFIITNYHKNYILELNRYDQGMSCTDSLLLINKKQSYFIPCKITLPNEDEAVYVTYEYRTSHNSYTLYKGEYDPNMIIKSDNKFKIKEQLSETDTVELIMKTKRGREWIYPITPNQIYSNSLKFNIKIYW